MIVRTARLALLLVLLVVVQTTLMPHLRIAGVVPDLGLVVAVALAVRYGPELGATFGFVAGLAADVFLQTPLGLSAFAFGLTAFTVGVLQSALVRPAWWVRPALAAAAGIMSGLLFVGLGALVGQSQLWALRSIRTILLAAVYDGVVALVLFPLTNAVARVDPRDISPAGASGYGSA
ncbi:MAG: rod shape-determining protein MreD [Acidimicrobiia bacterium]